LFTATLGSFIALVFLIVSLWLINERTKMLTAYLILVILGLILVLVALPTIIEKHKK